ncbi:SLBB domain-containing protein [Acidobacteriota bacterium]
MKSAAHIVFLLILIISTGNQPAAAGEEGYRVGPGDILRINVWGFDDLTQTVVVSEDSSFRFPLVGAVECGNLSVTDIEKKLRDMLADGYLKNPQVTIMVREYHSQKVNVLGEVSRPGSYALKGRTTLLEILSQAGGVNPKAGNKILILRDSDGKEKTAILEPAVIDLGELLAGSAKEEFMVEGGHTVFVPESDYFFVLGEVNKPGVFKMEKAITVLQAITMAGGFTAKASTKKIKVIREDKGKKVEAKIDHDDPVQPQDTIMVPESFF